MVRILIFLFALMFAPTASVAGFITCPENIPLFKRVSETNDERVSAIFVEVVMMAKLRDKNFALCESKEFSPAIFPIEGTDGRGFAVVLPRSIRHFSDTVIQGLVAHELGHVSRMNAVGGTSVELAADMQAIEWVGKDAIVEALRAMQKNVKRFPKWQQDLGRHQLQYRLNALIYGLYEAY